MSGTTTLSAGELADAAGLETLAEAVALAEREGWAVRPDEGDLAAAIKEIKGGCDSVTVEVPSTRLRKRTARRPYDPHDLSDLEGRGGSTTHEEWVLR